MKNKVSGLFRILPIDIRNTLLRGAVFERNRKVINILINAGAFTEEGMLASVISKNAEELKYFIEIGADVNYSNCIAFSVAAIDRNYEIISILKKAGAIPNDDVLRELPNEVQRKIEEL